MGSPVGHKKRGGRVAGTLNKKTQNLIDKCDAFGIDPFTALLELTNDPDVSLRFAALKEICQYIYPKRKAIELDANVDMRVIERIKEFEALPEKELKKIADGK